MKRIKKLASLLLTMIMALSMTMTAFASANTNNPNTPIENKNRYTIKIEGKTMGHVYEAYQVFAGDVAQQPQKDAQGNEVKDENNNTVYVKTLSNIRWATGINTTTAVGTGNNAKTLAEALKEKIFTSNEDIMTDNKLDASKVAKELTVKGEEAAKLFADVISAYLPQTVSGTTTGEPTQTANGYEYTMTVDAAGYYLVKDKAGQPTSGMTDGSGNTGTYTDFILEVVADAIVQSKDTTVVWEKKILTPGTQPGATVVPEDENKANVGDNVAYQLKATVPDYTAYNAYYFVMVDTMSKGLDFKNDVAVSVINKDTKVATPLVAGTDYYIYVVTKTAAGETETMLTGKEDTTQAQLITAAKEASTDKVTMIKIAFPDIKANTKIGIGDDIVATYNVKVNKDAKQGVEGEPNKYHLDYSRNPNYKYPEPDDDDEKPGLPDIENPDVIGSTPDDRVVTYVTKLEITKTDEDGKVLEGAEFTLTGYSTQIVAGSGYTFTEYGENETPEEGNVWYQLANGEYTKTAPSEATMRLKDSNVDADSKTTGYVELRDGETYDKDDAVTVNGKTYRPRRTGDTGDVYVLVADNTGYYASTTKIFKQTEVTAPTPITRYVKLVGTSGADGKVVFEGLGEGTFEIEETVTPAGFNTIAPVTLVTEGDVQLTNGEISTGEEECKWVVAVGSTKIPATATEPEKDMFGTLNGASYTATIVNRSGSLLPSTGGIGTTIFYVVGGILVIGAGILLVAKKRMGKR